MIIDAHVHICPDKIAAASAKVFYERNKFAWIYDGTVGTMVRLMDETCIAKAVMVNVVLNPEFVPRANDCTASRVSEFPNQLLGFVYIHPESKNPAGELERCVKPHGFKAVKINGSLLRYFPEDERMQPVYKKAMDLGIPILTHAGPTLRISTNYPRKSKTSSSQSRRAGSRCWGAIPS